MPANNSTATAAMQGDWAARWSAASGTGSVSQCSGTVSITSPTAATLTLATPLAGPAANGGDDGKTLVIMSETAQAHVVSAPGLFNGGAKGTATFGAAAGNNIVLIARNGFWYVQSSVGATLS